MILNTYFIQPINFTYSSYSQKDLLNICHFTKGIVAHHAIGIGVIGRKGG